MSVSSSNVDAIARSAASGLSKQDLEKLMRNPLIRVCKQTFFSVSFEIICLLISYLVF